MMPATANKLREPAGMATEAPPVRVFFSCQACWAVYRTTQTRKRAVGKFNCEVCGGEVHVWSGHHDYTRWEQVSRAPS